MSGKEAARCNGKKTNGFPFSRQRVRIKKETNHKTRAAGFGLQAVTSIAKGVTIGYFVQERESDNPDSTTYCVKVGAKYKIMYVESLMNKINTFVDTDDREKYCNCKIMNPNNKGQVGVQTIKAVKKGAMLYIKYNDNTHY